MGEETTEGGEETAGEDNTGTLLTDEDQTDEQKAEAAKTAEEAAAKAAEDPKAKDDHDTDEKSEDGDTDKDKDGAPEEYADFTLPEGMELDTELLSEAAPIFKELGATQDVAQKLIDLQSKSIAKFADAQMKAWTDRVGEWKTSAEDDEEYGKGKFDESIVVARRAIREVGGAGLAKALKETGMGDHPEFIRVFYRIGKAIGEDSLNFGGGSKEGGKSIADRIFNGNKSKG